MKVINKKTFVIQDKPINSIDKNIWAILKDSIVLYDIEEGSEEGLDVKILRYPPHHIQELNITTEVIPFEIYGKILVKFDRCDSIVKLPEDIIKDIESQKLAKTIEQRWGEVRYLRNFKIEEVSWMVERHLQQKELLLKEPTLTDSKYVELLKYIQNLRDITQQSDPFQIEWPEIEF
jgi:hypothetical protein